MSEVSVPVGFSAMGRSIDLKYPSNVLAVGVAAGTAVVVGAYNLIVAEPLASSWLQASVGVFLSWAIGRELDPDRNLSAALAMAVSFLAVAGGAPSLLFGLGLLMTTRLCTGTAGVGIEVLDAVALVIVGGLLATAAVSFVVLPGLALAVLVATAGSRRGLWMAGVVVASGVAVAILAGPWFLERNVGPTSLLMVAVVIATVALTVPAGAPQSTADVGGEILLSWRVTMARVIAAATVIAAFVVAGDAGIEAAFGTGGAALVGVMAANHLPQKQPKEPGESEEPEDSEEQHDQTSATYEE